MTRRISPLNVVLALFFVYSASAQTPLDDHFFTSEGVRIRYVDVGRGEPVVLVHGFSSSLDANWGNLGIIEKLSKDFRVIALDCRGHGKSDKPHDAASYGINMIEDVTRLLDHLAVRRAHIVGYSMGGAIAGKFITTHRDRVISAVFGGSAPRVSSGDRKPDDVERVAPNGEQSVSATQVTQRVDAQVRRPPVCTRVRRGRRTRHARGAACGGWRSGAAG
jgi:pimeloyl-ACP methyl ester carboxylesterase